MTRHAPHTYLLAALYDAWNLATEPLRKWAKGADEWLCDYGNSDD